MPGILRSGMSRTYYSKSARVSSVISYCPLGLFTLLAIFESAEVGAMPALHVKCVFANTSSRKSVAI